MTAPDTLDTLLREALSAMDAGDVATLERLLSENPWLVRDRLDSPGAWLREQVGDALDGFFERPYLLWFVAEDPVRNGKLPANIAQMARVILKTAERQGVDSLQEQLDYALRLVAWSWIARNCGVQIELIDVLIDAGASPGETIPYDALVNGNFAAAGRLVEHGAPLTLATALCLERWEDVERLAPAASARDRQGEEAVRGCDLVPVDFIVSGRDVQKGELTLVFGPEVWQNLPFIDLVASPGNLFPSVLGYRRHGTYPPLSG